MVRVRALPARVGRNPLAYRVRDRIAVPLQSTAMSRFAFRPFLLHPVVRSIAWVVVVLAIGSGVIGGVWRGLHDGPDWRSFYRESRYVWEHREIPPATGMFGYLPTTFFSLWPFAVWSPGKIGLYAFVLLNLTAAVVTLSILRRYWFADTNGPDARLFVWPLFLFVAHFQHPMQANQFTIWVLALCVIGLTLLMRKREWSGGLILGLAGCLKLTPFLFLLYALCRRRWRTIGGTLLAVIAFDLVPAVTFFGWQGAIREHRNWLRRVDAYSARRFIDDPNLRVLRHGNNCSYAIVLARWLRSPPAGDRQVVLRGDPPEGVIDATRSALGPDEFLTLDTMPVEDGTWSIERYDLSDTSRVPRFHVADLSVNAVWLIWAGTLVIGLGAACVATIRRRPLSGDGPAWRAEAALWMLLMLWPSPMLRDYYLALTFPAYVVVWRTLAARRPLWSAGPRFWVAGSIASIYVSVPSLASHTANWYGVHLVTTAVLTAATVWVWRSELSTAAAKAPGTG